ncbi:OadG family protein [Pseudomonadota bacterium]
MAVPELLMEGFDLLVIGMGTVFVFLAVLVVTVGFMSKVAHYFEAPVSEQDAPVRDAPALDAPVAPVTNGVSAQHIAAISGAVNRYQASHGS